MLQEFPGKCADGIYVLDNTNSVMASKQRRHLHPESPTLQNLHCKELKRVGKIGIHHNISVVPFFDLVKLH